MLWHVFQFFLNVRDLLWSFPSIQLENLLRAQQRSFLHPKCHLCISQKGQADCSEWEWWWGEAKYCKVIFKASQRRKDLITVTDQKQRRRMQIWKEHLPARLSRKRKWKEIKPEAADEKCTERPDDDSSAGGKPSQQRGQRAISEESLWKRH